MMGIKYGILGSHGSMAIVSLIWRRARSMVEVITRFTVIFGFGTICFAMTRSSPSYVESEGLV